MENKEDNSPMFWRNFKAWFKAKTTAEEDVISSEDAYCRATYGCSTLKIDDIIKLHQHQINNVIKSKTLMRSNGDTFTDYTCTYSFPKDVEPYISNILEIFKDKGYNIIKLSDYVPGLQNERVYFISWYKDSL